MGQEPEAIRDEIEHTRERMTETVDALGYKADVKGRAGDYVSDKKDALMGKAHGVAEAADSLVSRVSGTVPDPRSAKDRVPSATSNPLGLALGSVAAGFLIGMLLPSTRIEDERMGELADDVKDRVKETGQEALEHGKEVAQETAQVAMDGARDAAQTAIETAKQSGQEHADELKESAQANAQGLPGVNAPAPTPDTGIDPAGEGVGELETQGPIGGPPPVRQDYR